MRCSRQLSALGSKSVPLISNSPSPIGVAVNKYGVNNKPVTPCISPSVSRLAWEQFNATQQVQWASRKAETTTTKKSLVLALANEFKGNSGDNSGSPSNVTALVTR